MEESNISEKITTKTLRDYFKEPDKTNALVQKINIPLKSNIEIPLKKKKLNYDFNSPRFVQNIRKCFQENLSKSYISSIISLNNYLRNCKW